MSDSSLQSSSDAASPGLFVLGMHRSGTSCLTGMLEGAGFNIGDVDRWNPDNQKGNREHLAITPLNEGVLRAHGGSWDSPPEALEVDETQRVKMNVIVSGLEDERRPWLIKDPRILFLADSWLGLRPNARRLGVLRHPLAVARSLERRNGLATDAGVQLWCRYNQRLLELLEKRPFSLLLFTADPDRLVRSITAVLEKDFSEEIRQEAVQPERLADFFDAGLVHHAPSLGLDLRDELTAAGVTVDIAEAASLLWRELVHRQAPHPLRLEERAPAPRSEEDTASPPQIDAADAAALDRAIEVSGNPVPLFRARITLLNEQGAHAELAAWLGKWHDQRPDDPFLALERARAAWAAGDRNAAVRHAETAERLAPSWAEPPARLAEWAWIAGNWEDAASRYRSLYAAQSAVGRPPAVAAQIFFDRGEGFTAEASITQRLSGDEVSFNLSADRLEEGSLGRGVHRLRLDPANQPAVVTDLAVQVTLVGGETTDLECHLDNALFRHEGTWHFQTDDPQLHFDLGPRAPADIESIAVSFTLLHRGDAVREANASALVALTRLLPTLHDLREKLTSLDTEQRAMEQAVAAARESVGGGLPGWLVSQLTRGGVPAALERLEQRWKSLDALLASLPNRQED
ncbi:MAG: hypothetical protein AAGA95_04345 [Pseudomonadota bacterium]